MQNALWSIHMAIVEGELPVQIRGAEVIETTLADIPWGKYPFVGLVRPLQCGYD
jgi:hypothetical protein